MFSSDVIVIGGGLVGTAVAYGLGQLGKNVTVLDEGDDAFRASRGNFGLIGVHGKGRGFPQYARWTGNPPGNGPRWPRAFSAKPASTSRPGRTAHSTCAFPKPSSKRDFHDSAHCLHPYGCNAGGAFPSALPV